MFIELKFKCIQYPKTPVLNSYKNTKVATFLLQTPFFDENTFFMFFTRQTRAQNCSKLKNIYIQIVASSITSARPPYVRQRQGKILQVVFALFLGCIKSNISIKIYRQQCTSGTFIRFYRFLHLRANLKNHRFRVAARKSGFYSFIKSISSVVL